MAITYTALKSLTNITDTAMFVIAAMVAAPAAMGIGIAYFILLRN